jgi:hypothetical protein
MATQATGPFSAIHGAVAQPAHHSIVCGYHVVDSRAELSIHIENPSQHLLKRGKASDRLLGLWPMNKAIERHNFVKKIQVLLPTASSKYRRTVSLCDAVDIAPSSLSLQRCVGELRGIVILSIT